MPDPKKLIEVAMPVKEISAESVRDKSIRHGHISTLHLWWARRPLPVCRAVVFASLVPDPMDDNCPQAFKDAVALLLDKSTNPGDPYKPYEDIPYTAAHDKMEDNLRNRLLMFIGKFSDKFIDDEKKGKKTESKNQLSSASLIKWESKNDDEIIGKARKLIWVSHNSGSGKTAKELIDEYNKHYKAIKEAENDLYNTPDRHIESDAVKTKEVNLQKAIDVFLDKMPKVFDPFAGGGAIPLEATRLGCRTYANDINPVAHIIQKGSIEFPQKFGKPITYSNDEFVKLYGEEEFDKIDKEDLIYNKGNITGVKIENRLAFDVEFYAKKLLKITGKEIEYLYPKDENGNRPIAYYWARVGICSNPSCKAEVPLLKEFYLANTKSKTVYLKPVIQNKSIDFEIKRNKHKETGWVSSKSLICPCCGAPTAMSELKEQSKNGLLKQRLIAVIEETDKGKNYRLPTENELKLSIIDEASINSRFIPNEKMLEIPDLVSGRGWGINKWSQLFSTRQLLAMQTLVMKLNEIKSELNFKNNEYYAALLTYLGIQIDRISSRQTSFGLWHTKGEKLEQPFGRQAIPMVFDYPESNPFATSGGGYLNQLEWIIRYINSESKNEFQTICENAASGEKEQFPTKFLTSVVTDPPYYDAIAYADLSDFFYVWLKRTIGDIYPMNFATPNTPKSDECTALKHHHNGNYEKAKQHFEKKLTKIFDSIEHQTSDTVSIMFAHQSTEAWTTLCNSILGARMNITSSWANDTEMTGALKTDKSFLSSSVTVGCIPARKSGIVSFKQIKINIMQNISYTVDNLYKLGFRGVDLLTACFGQTVCEFGKYEKVEKADGSEVTVGELLELARDSAFNALVKGFPSDEFTKFYLGWLQLFGFSESDFDDVNRLVKIGLSIETRDLFAENILIKNGNSQTLANFSERFKSNKHLGENSNSNLIDIAHRAMHLYKSGNRTAILSYISSQSLTAESTFWRLLNSLVEILPQASEDYKQVRGLLDNKDSLLREAKATAQPKTEQEKLFS